MVWKETNLLLIFFFCNNSLAFKNGAIGLEGVSKWDGEIFDPAHGWRGMGIAFVVFEPTTYFMRSSFSMSWFFLSAGLVLGLGFVMATGFAPRGGIAGGAAIGTPTTVSGNVQPIDGALHAFLYSSTDTVSTNVDITTGRFEFSTVKPGSYQLFIEGRPPYSNNVRNDIMVADGKPNDVGVIVMSK
jgi:hypothetical protein